MSEPTVAAGDSAPELESEQTVTTTDTLPDGEVESQTVDTKFYNQHDGTTGRLPGQYLDEIERNQAEVLRAKAEGREPDLNNPGSTAGTPIVTEGSLTDNSINHRDLIDEDAPTAQPVQTLPVDQTGGSLADNTGNPSSSNPNAPVDSSYEDQVAAENEVTGDNASADTSATPSDAVVAQATTPDPSVTGVTTSAGTMNPTTPMTNNDPAPTVTETLDAPTSDATTNWVDPRSISDSTSDTSAGTGA